MSLLKKHNRRLGRPSYADLLQTILDPCRYDFIREKYCDIIQKLNFKKYDKGGYDS
jgi:hypothetical protein